MSDYLNNPIFITGIERSGSTIIAKIVHHCGAFSGAVSEMQENKKIKTFVESHYAGIGADPKGQYPLPKTENLSVPGDWKQKVSNCIVSDRYMENKPWMLKSHSLTQIWPIWHLTYPDVKWVIVRRKTGDITHSCLKTAYMSAFANELNLQAVGGKEQVDGWLWWVKQHEKCFNEMVQAGVQYKEVWPERMVNGDFSQVKEMIEWLGLTWVDSVVDLVAPLFNSKQKERK